MDLIQIDHVTRTFPNAPRPAVDDVSLAVGAGSFVTLLGPSGCGKTTLLKMVNRLYEPASGRILVNGEDTAGISPTELRRHIGYVIQQTGLFPHLRIEDNIATVPRLLRWDKARIERRIDEMLDLVNLPLDYRRRYPRQLSGGEQQRVGVARALAADPPIVLMDEPFGAIDAINRTRLQDELCAIQTRLHKTILFVTHDVEEAFKLGDRIVVMREGRIVQEAPPLVLATAPADEFVASLVGAGDMLRRLSLLPVGSALLDADGRTANGDKHGGLPTIAASENLRAALGLLLQSGAPALHVVDGDGVTLGRLDFGRIAMPYLLSNGPRIAELSGQHFYLTLVSLGIAILIGLPLGVLIQRVQWLRGPVLAIFSVLYTVPSLSLLVLLIPLTGLSATTAIVALVIYAQLVIVRNTLAGLEGVDARTVEAAQGMGMNNWQRLWRVELPLAAPVILAGIRIAAVATIGIATIAAFINAGGLGVLLFEGVRTSNYDKIVAGAIAVSLLAIAINWVLRVVERQLELRVRGV